MFLREASAALKSLSGRLAFSYLLFFLSGVVLIFSVLFYSMQSYLEQKDHAIIEARFQQYQQLYESEGLPGLRKILTEARLRAQSAGFLIYLKDSLGKPVFLHLPDEIENFDVKELEAKLANQPLPVKPVWFNMTSKNGDEDALEVWAAKLESGYFLHVGARTDNRDEIAEHIFKISMSLLVPFLIIAISGTFIIAKRSLKPIRRLIETVTNIKNGDLSSRVPIHESHDELYELALLFNEMIERLQNLMNALRETIDNLAHDLKTPITRFKMASELALRSGDDLEIKNALTVVIEESEEVQSLIQTIMRVSEISNKIIRPKRILFSLNNVISEILDVYFFAADEKSIKLVFESENETNYQGDRILIKQAIANLLDNAIKYSPSGKTVRIHLQQQNQQIFIRIIDQGIGIDAADLPRVWERLYRSDKSRYAPGLGLGLSLVKAIIEAHDAQVEVESKLHQGSTFTIILQG